VIIDAMAASCGSLIAMAGDSITMRAGSQMMIHGPSGVAFGKAGEIENLAEHMRNVERCMAEIYAERSGADVDELLAEMSGEIWLSPDDAIARGFATHRDDAKSSTVTAFDFRQYANAPKKLVAMAKKEKWSFDPSAQKVAPVAPKPVKHKENPSMSTKPTATAPLSDPDTPAQLSASDVKDRIKAITQDEAAAGFETLASHLAFETEMPAPDAIVALKAAASRPQVQTAEPPLDPKAYQAQRTAASELAQPSVGREAPMKTAALSDAVARTNQRR
jgi:hypothetical protein